MRCSDCGQECFRGEQTCSNCGKQLEEFYHYDEIDFVFYEPNDEQNNGANEKAVPLEEAILVPRTKYTERGLLYEINIMECEWNKSLCAERFP